MGIYRAIMPYIELHTSQRQQLLVSTKQIRSFNRNHQYVSFRHCQNRSKLDRNVESTKSMAVFYPSIASHSPTLSQVSLNLYLISNKRIFHQSNLISDTLLAQQLSFSLLKWPFSTYLLAPFLETGSFILVAITF